MTHQVILSLAANQCQKHNLAKARLCLGEVLSQPAFTDELWTDPVNSSRRAPYLNQLAAATTSLTLDELTQQLKAMEQRLGRTPEKRRQGIVPIDIDILRYDDQLLHQRDWQRPYVTSLLPQLPPFPPQP
jgi:2-amino-4-hydroxy-6-hydroxymethyldihydropteridine diphosphokinase